MRTRPAPDRGSPAPVDLRRLTPAAVMRLQATAGNAAVRTLLREDDDTALVVREKPLLYDDLPGWVRPGVELIDRAIAEGLITADEMQRARLTELLRALIRDVEDDDPEAEQSGYISLGAAVSFLIGQDVLGLIGDADVLVSRAWLARRGLVAGPSPLTAQGSGEATSNALVPSRNARVQEPELPDISHLFRPGGSGGSPWPLKIPPGGFRILRPMNVPTGPLLLTGPPQGMDPSAGPRDDPAVVIRQLGGDEGLVRFFLDHPPPSMEALVLGIQLVRDSGSERRLVIDLLELAGSDGQLVATVLPLLRKRKVREHTLLLTTVDRSLALLRSDAKRADQLFGHLLDAEPPLSPGQLDEALGVFERTNNLQHVEGFVGGKRGAAHGQAPHHSPTSSLLPPPLVPAIGGPVLGDNPVERVLGVPGAAGQIRGRIGSEGSHPRPYTLTDVATQAQRLLAVGISGAQALAILIAVCETQDTAVRFTRATDVGCELAQTPALIPGIAGFMAAQPAIVRRQNLTQVITDLRQRPGAAMPVLTNILVLLNPLPTVADIIQLLTRMPPRPDVPLPRLHGRLQTTLAATLAGGLGLDLPTTSAQAGQVETALAQMVANSRLTAEGQNALRTVFQLLPITWPRLQTFLAVPAVRATLTNPLRTNAAGWLRWFAVGHAGRPPGGMADVPVNVAHSTGARVVNIDAWIIDHVRERHTFENFSFDDGTIDRAPNSTFFNPGMSDADLIALITRSITHADVRASAWGDPELNADAVKLRIRHEYGAWRVRQYFFSVGPPYIQIPATVLHAIQALHDWQ